MGERAPCWVRASAAPAPPTAREAHVWRLCWDVAQAGAGRWPLLLSATEAERMGRFRFERHRHAYAVAHGWLRWMLSLYLDCDAGQIDFVFSAKGKPELREQRGGEPLRFSLSHTERMVLLALTRRHDIGVDVEWRRGVPEADGIVTRYFSPSEVAAYRGLVPEERPEAFFNCWTRREAILKATGDGIATDLAQIEVSCEPGVPARIISLWGNAAAAQAWQLVDLGLGPEHAGALAVCASGLNVLCWEFDASAWLSSAETVPVDGDV